MQGRSVKGSTLTAHKVDRVVNAPKVEDGEDDIVADSKVSTVVQIDEVTPIAKTEVKEIEISESITQEEIINEIESNNGKGIKDQGTFDFQDN